MESNHPNHNDNWVTASPATPTVYTPIKIGTPRKIWTFGFFHVTEALYLWVIGVYYSRIIHHMLVRYLLVANSGSDRILEFDLARPPGFEPGQRGLEALVLPLHYRRIKFGYFNIASVGNYPILHDAVSPLLICRD
jgi:hypothetical protein